MNEVKKPKKPLMIYYALVLIVLLLINMLLVPYLAEKQVKEVDYGTFMEMTENKEIGQVEISDNEILFTDKSGNNYYKTGVISDDGLVDRLYQSGAQFSSEIVQQMSPLMNLLLTLILPLVIFIGLGQWMSKKLMQKMGGSNSMMFNMGKSNAKVMSNPPTASNSPMWPVRMRPRRIWRKSSTISMTPPNTRPSVLPCPRVSCWWALPAPVKPCWPKR